MELSPSQFVRQRSPFMDYPFHMSTRSYPTQIRNNPHPFKVRSVKGFLGLPTQMVETDDDVQKASRRTVEQFVKDSLKRGDWKYKESYIKKTKDLDSILALQYFTGLQNYSFKQDYLPYLGYHEYFTDWRKQLRQITETAYQPLLDSDVTKEKDEAIQELNHPNEWLNGPILQKRSKTMYSETGRLIPSREMKSKSCSSQRLRSETSRSDLPLLKVGPDLDKLDAVVFMLLSDLLQTQSVHLIQKWLCRSTERERALITSMLQAAISQPQVSLDTETPKRTPKTSEVHRKYTSKSAEMRIKTSSNRKEGTDILVLEADDTDLKETEELRPPTSSTFKPKNEETQYNDEKCSPLKNGDSVWSQEKSINK